MQTNGKHIGEGDKRGRIREIHRALVVNLDFRVRRRISWLTQTDVTRSQVGLLESFRPLAIYGWKPVSVCKIRQTRLEEMISTLWKRYECFQV